MKFVFLLNRFTIGKDLDKIIDKIKKAAIKHNLDYIIEINSLDYSTEEILKKYQENYIIMTVGGDGLVNRVLNCIIGTSNILGVIPYGTGNDLYKSIKKQYQDKINECDLIKINDKYFINTACFGIDADVANNESVMKSKLIPKKFKYIFGLIWTFIKYKGRYLEVYIDNEKYKEKFTTVAVCNGEYYGNGFNINPYSELNNGLFDVLIAPYIKKINLITLILGMKKGKHIKDKNIIIKHSNNMIIKSRDNIKCNIDGEILEAKEFNISVLEKKMKIYYNEELIKDILN